MNLSTLPKAIFYATLQTSISKCWNTAGHSPIRYSPCRKTSRIGRTLCQWSTPSSSLSVPSRTCLVGAPRGQWGLKQSRRKIPLCTYKTEVNRNCEEYWGYSLYSLPLWINSFPISHHNILQSCPAPQIWGIVCNKKCLRGSWWAGTFYSLPRTNATSGPFFPSTNQ